jgi:hypothetical protein
MNLYMINAAALTLILHNLKIRADRLVFFIIKYINFNSH